MPLRVHFSATAQQYYRLVSFGKQLGVNSAEQSERNGLVTAVLAYALENPPSPDPLPAGEQYTDFYVEVKPSLVEKVQAAVPGADISAFINGSIGALGLLADEGKVKFTDGTLILS